MSSTLVLGIHIGDTTCSVAVHRQGIIDVVANEQGSRVTPAVVAFTDVETLLGEPARAQLAKRRPQPGAAAPPPSSPRGCRCHDAD